MNAAQFLEALPHLAFQAVLVMCRVGACGMVLPGLGETEVSSTIRLGLALAVVALLLPGLESSLPREPETIAATLQLVGTELAIGFWLGWLARLMVFALTIAGQTIGFFIGLASVLTPDPTVGSGGTAVGRFLGMAGTVLVLSTGLYAIPLRALAESYEVLPAGGPLALGGAAETVAAATAASFSLALRLAAPLLLLSLLLQMGSGLLARVAPQAQVYILAAPAQTLAGVALLAVILPALLAHWAEAARAAFALLPGLG
ncbi:flagellar biosynthetic protein FliR [Roseomonas sp. USHLN139]|uniref:flagellar biosynthetic protein FliR n=1 Tax=Roseomonas sp. USHLN139 TaxID=3081298 RepID=UPI003B013679